LVRLLRLALECELPPHAAEPDGTLVREAAGVKGRDQRIRLLHFPVVEQLIDIELFEIDIIMKVSPTGIMTKVAISVRFSRNSGKPVPIADLPAASLRSTAEESRTSGRWRRLALLASAFSMFTTASRSLSGSSCWAISKNKKARTPALNTPATLATSPQLTTWSLAAEYSL
jgi:hypothetical protein